MDWRSALYGMILFGIIAGLSAIASQEFGEADRNAAVAAAVEQHLSGWLGEKPLKELEPSQGLLKLCLESKVPLKIDRIAKAFSQTVVRPIPMTSCSSKTVEGDFGMFVAITRYYDSTGEQAGHLEIAKVTCPTTSRCLVDIDDFGVGMSYEVARRGSLWRTVRREMRWIV